MSALMTQPTSADVGMRPDAWSAIVAPASGFLESVSRRMEAQVGEFEPEIAGYARYALENQGKQLRPTLVALAAGAVGRPGDDLVTVAVIIEMIHLATLVHDDIMDEASVRRRRATLAAKWGNEVAVLLGDCLFAHALKLAAAMPTNEVSRLVAAASGRVCAGEILQSHRRRRWTVDRSDYFKVIEMKTAELFGLACELGARMAGGVARESDSLRRFGLALGTAYQIYDDCLDLYGVEAAAGKSLGTDLAGGKVTLPLIVFFERAGPEARSRMLSLLERRDAADFGDVLAAIDAHCGLGESRRVIGDFLNDARSALSLLRAGPEAGALSSLCDFLAGQTALLPGG